MACDPCKSARSRYLADGNTDLARSACKCVQAGARTDGRFPGKDRRSRPDGFLWQVAAVAVVGNEDGAHHVSAELFQALNDVGFTIPANAVAYWVGEAMGSTNFVDLKETPEAVQTMVSMLARNAAHLAGLLQQSQYPGEEE